MSDVVDKIRKLLALARDKRGNEHESARAMAIAQRMMLEHNIEESMIVEESKIDVMRGKWVPVADRKWTLLLASAVATMYSCRLVTSNSVGDPNRFNQFVGRKINVEVAEMTLPWVIDQVDGFYKEGLRLMSTRKGDGLTKSERAEFRRTFKEACAIRVWQRAAEIVATLRNEIPGHKALVVIDQSLAAADDMLKDMKKGRDLEPLKHGTGTVLGVMAAERVQLQRTVD